MTDFYGFVGAHRTGKTTLAERVADTLELPFVKTTISQAMKDLGLSPQADIPFWLRLDVQELLLECLISSYARAKAQYPAAPLILVDRTPLDILAYTNSEILRTTMEPWLMERMAKHEARCVETTNFNFAGMCLVQIGLPPIHDPDKAPANRFYQRHIHATMLEAIHRLDVEPPVWLLNQRNLQLKSRVSEVIEHVRSIISSREAHNSASQLVRSVSSLH